MLDRSDRFEGVIAIALNKDGSQFLMSSTMSMLTKTFLVNFAFSWVMEWFHHENAE
jgi:hypothetical protein